jgi:hypothetical protein
MKLFTVIRKGSLHTPTLQETSSQSYGILWYKNKETHIYQCICTRNVCVASTYNSRTCTNNQIVIL